jgi:hypothetical protein
MSDIPTLEERLSAWLVFLESEKAETTPINAIILPDGSKLIDDVRWMLRVLREEDEA